MNEDNSEDRPDYSGMSDDELFEIVNSRFGQYRQEVIDGAKDELKRRAERPKVEPGGHGHGGALAEGGGQVTEGEPVPPVPPPSVPGASVYTPGQITLATFLGSPIAGCLLLAQNCQALRNVGAAWKPLVIGIGVTILLLAVGFMLPENRSGSCFTIGYCVAIYYYAKESQGDAIENHLRAGGRRGSWAVAVLTGIVCLVLILALLFVIFMALDALGAPVA